MIYAKYMNKNTCIVPVVNSSLNLIRRNRFIFDQLTANLSDAMAKEDDAFFKQLYFK